MNNVCASPVEMIAAGSFMIGWVLVIAGAVSIVKMLVSAWLV